MRIRNVFAFVLATVTCSVPLVADIVHLKNGAEVEGRVVDQGESVHVEFQTGSMTVEKSTIDRIEERLMPQQEFNNRFFKNRNDPEGCVELARWALRKSLKKEYVRALRQARHIDPEHADARKLLQDYHLRMEYLPANDVAAEALRKEFGQRFQVRRTHHFRVCYSSSDLYAEITGNLLEAVYRQFIRFFEDRSFYPVPLTDRMEVILFKTRRKFLDHASQLGNDMSGAAGFYLTETDRSYFYDAVNDAKYEGHLRELEDTQLRLNKSRQEVSETRSGTVRYKLTRSDGTEATLSRHEMLVYLDEQQAVLDGQFAELRRVYGQQNIINTVHEAVHQLAYSCGIHSRYCENPKWLVEGLALYFESANGRQWNGPGTVLPDRLKLFLEGSGTARDISLRELISSDAIFDTTRSRAGEAYAAAWALFYYLAEREHDAFFDYVYDLSNRIDDDAYSTQERLDEFAAYFSDIPRVERRWRDYIEDQSVYGGR